MMIQSVSLMPHQQPSTLDYIRLAVQRLVGPQLAKINVEDPQIAHRICQLIPAQCPFERDVILFGHKLLHIPAMCKLNPVYNEVMELRFRALVYLAEHCGEDVSQYCR